MESRESKERILEILNEMFRNHNRAKIVSICEEKQWKIENCIESLLANDIASSQGAVPKAGTRSIDRFSNFEKSSSEQKILDFINGNCRVMVIMRGAPGCGKSYLSRLLVKSSKPDIKDSDLKNFIFSTDDYFINKHGIYNRQVKKLSEAHYNNQKKVEAKAVAGSTPIIVDNTNLQIWEMLPYVQIAVKNGYHVELLEPNTPWKRSAGNLAKKNTHGVPFEHIKSMLEKYEPVTAEQLIQIVKKRIPADQIRAKAPIHDTNIATSKIATPKIQNYEQNTKTKPLSGVSFNQNHNILNNNRNNFSMRNSFQAECCDVEPVPLRDITIQAKTNENIQECYNPMPYQQSKKCPTNSAADFKHISAAVKVNVSTQTYEHANNIEANEDEFVELQLNTGIVNQLYPFFGFDGDGEANIFEGANEFLNVSLPRALARALYQECRKARQEKNQKHIHEADENFAKLIQNSKYSEINQAPKNLQELLDYEMGIRLINSEASEQQQQQSSQETLATYLKKIKLTENTPETANQPEEKPSEAKVKKLPTYENKNKSSALKEFEEFRNLAVHHCQLKAECYQKAKEMVQKRNSAVAGYYAQIAQYHKKKIDIYNERAANSIVEVHMLTADNPELLDLHHLHVAEAIECLDLFLDHHISIVRGSMRTYKHVFIITGRGLHSTGGVSIIKNKVKARLKDRNLKWNEVNPGLLKVKIFASSRFTK